VKRNTASPAACPVAIERRPVADEHERDVAEPHERTSRQERAPGDALPVELRAVATAEVSHLPAAVAAGELGVIARHGAIEDDEVAGRPTPDGRRRADRVRDAETVDEPSGGVGARARGPHMIGKESLARRDRSRTVAAEDTDAWRVAAARAAVHHGVDHTTSTGSAPPVHALFTGVSDV
jgi:hypothetical protein